MRIPEGYITAKDAAEIAGVSVQTIYGWVRSGYLPARRLGPRRVLIRHRDLTNALGDIDARNLAAGGR